MTRLEIAHRIAVFAVYSLLFGYLGRVLYLISERLWITVRRWLEHYQVSQAFNAQPIRFRDQGVLIETVRAEMQLKREAEYEDIDADYSALTIEETTESSRSAA